MFGCLSSSNRRIYLYNDAAEARKILNTGKNDDNGNDNNL